MSQRRPAVFSPKAGGFDVDLSEDERALLHSLPGQLAAAISSLVDSDSPVPDSLRRLFPVAYPTDEELQAAYELANVSALAEHHRHALEVLAASSEATRVSNQQAEEWLDAVNSLRLALGAVLQVTEEAVEPEVDDPVYPEWLCYHYLTYLESEIVDAIAAALPEPTPDADESLPEDPWGEPPGGLRWDGTPVPEPE